VGDVISEERRAMKDSLAQEVKALRIEITALQETMEELRALNHSEKARVIDMPRRAN
jgi:nitrate/nitrite-specific signal transduction histidine kinase